MLIGKQLWSHQDLQHVLNAAHAHVLALGAPKISREKLEQHNLQLPALWLQGTPLRTKIKPYPLPSYSPPFHRYYRPFPLISPNFKGLAYFDPPYLPARSPRCSTLVHRRQPQFFCHHWKLFRKACFAQIVLAVVQVEGWQCTS